MAFEWLNRWFQPSGTTRGLSGAEASALALDDANPYYNFRLRRHRAERDLLADPAQLWSTSDHARRRGGLVAHLGAERADGTLMFTDVLLVLSATDFERASRRDWLDAVARALRAEFDAWAAREGLQRARPARPLGVRIVADGSAETGGTRFGLDAGEFVTGVLPNLYTGPTAASRQIIAVYANIPGAWEGYREIGHLYDDQVLFTLGNHWLDNFTHPALREAALYRLQQYPDGSFYHIISPDLQDRYQVVSTDQGGANVLTVATRTGEALAYIVLAVVEAQPEPQLSLDPVPAPSGPPSIHGPDVAPPMLLDDSPLVAQDAGGFGSKTIIPEAPAERIFTLQERGALLQKVHFGAFMLGYDVFVGSRGELGTVVDRPVLTFQVRKKSVFVVAHQDGVTVAGQPAPTGEPMAVVGNAIIRFGSQVLEYRDLSAIEVDGWPYVGEIRRPASSTYMLWGNSWAIGRSPDSRVVLPDEPRNDNIHWKPGVIEGTMIRSRSGDIPKSRFYTDSIMVASEHARVDLTHEVPEVRCVASHCYTYVRRSGQIIALYPASSDKDPKHVPVRPGDEILSGNCLFLVSYSADADAPTASPAIWTGRADPSSVAVEDAPVARGLGEDGAPPPPVPVGPAPLDSFDGTSSSFQDRPAYHARPSDEPPPLPASPMTALRSLSDVPEPSAAPPVSAPPTPVAPPTSGSMARLKTAEPTALLSSDPGLPLEPLDEPDEPTAPGPTAAPAPEPAPAPTARTSASDAPAPGVARPPVTGLGRPKTELFERGVVGTRGEDWGEVVAVDDHEARIELGRRAQLIHAGWMVSGTVVCGNHSHADLILPETRLDPSQSFTPNDYFVLRIRGRRGQLEVLAADDVRVAGAAARPEPYEGVDGVVIEVIRRDDTGVEDFGIPLRVVDDRSLPDPRARLLEIDGADPLVAAVLVRGLPVRQARRLSLGGITFTATWDGARLHVSDYLDSYLTSSDYAPFFVRTAAEGRFLTAPEDGTPFMLDLGDAILVGSSVFVLRQG